MQRFRAASTEKYDELKKELDEVLQKEMATLGSQKDRIVEEIAQAEAAVKKRIDDIAEQKKKQMESRVKAQGLVAELEKLVEKAEASAKGVVEEGEPLQADKELKLAAIEACASAVEKAGEEASEEAKAAGDFMLKEGAAMKNTPNIPGEPPATCSADVAKLAVRLNASKQTLTTAIAKCKTAKATQIKKANAKAKYEKGFASFKKFDMDKDGKLSRREIQAFSKGEYSFSVPLEALDSICNVLIKDTAKGVDKKDFHRLKQMIGIAREAALDTKRKATREAREQELASLKEGIEANSKETAAKVTAASEAVSAGEKAIGPLNAGKAKTSVEMVALADETDQIIEAAKKALTTAREAITELNTETEPELKSFLALEVKKLQAMLTPLEQRANKAGGAASVFRGTATKKNTAELEKFRIDALAMIFTHQGKKKLENTGVYQAFDSKKKGKVDESSFVKFFKTCQMKDDDDERLSEENAARLFNYLDAEDAGFISKESFLNLIRKFMKVVKASVLTDDMSTKSAPKRRLVEGEVLEALTGPMEVEGEDITRIKVKAMSDDVEGWVTPVGNRGTIFVEDGGNVFKVVKETILTGSFVIGADTKTKDRKLKVGEVVEAREWARKEEASGLMRMKVAVKGDGQVGWVTSVGNTGITFLEVM
jgi:Ca2+-binding EF-hand superfamily protein